MRARILVVLLAAAAALSAWGASPDVVLISLDTFRPDRLERWGGSKDLTPNLNALAAGGAAYLECFTSAPITLPAHATLLTGRFPAVTGLHDNGMGTLAPSLPTLAEALRKRGYRTQAVVGSSVLASRFGLSRGFQVYDDGVGPSGMRSASQVTDRALAVLKERTKERAPLFLWVHYFDTHEPYVAPEAIAAKHAANPYDAAAAYVDAEVGRLLKALPAGCVVALVSDHGEGLGEHGEATHGVLLFQPTVRVLCLLSGPGTGEARTSRLPCSLADVAPTLYRLAAGAEFPCDGADLLALEKAPPEKPRRFPLETWLPFDQFRWSPLLGITDGRYKWIRGPVDRLFDLKEDPGESADLAASAPAGALELKAALAAIPESAPEAGEVDGSLRGPGYAPVPGGSLEGQPLPDPQIAIPLLKTLDDGRRLRLQGDPAGAAKIFKTATERDPANPTAWFELGESLRRSGELEAAGQALDHLLKLAPRMPEGWIARGHVWVALAKPEEAASCYQKALALDPGAVAALNPLAAHHLDLNQPDRAIPLLDRAVAGGFADSGTYLLRGRVRLVQKRMEEASSDFATALQLSPDPARTLKEEADSYMIRNLFEQGLRLYDQGIRSYPRYAPNYLTLATYYLQADQPERALPLFKKALACDLSPADRERVQGIISGLEQGGGEEE
jgi:choline-sulfatase